MPPFGMVGPSYTLDSKNADCQRCINWYVEIIDSFAGKSRARLARTPGLKVFSIPTGNTKADISSIAISRVGTKSATIKSIQVAPGDPGTPASATKGPTSVTQSASGQAWSDLDKAETLDAVPAKVALGVGQASQLLDVTGFGFSIPAGSTIQGIKATVYRKTQFENTSEVLDSLISLIKGVAYGENKASASPWNSAPNITANITYLQATDFVPGPDVYQYLTVTLDSVAGIAVDTYAGVTTPGFAYSGVIHSVDVPSKTIKLYYYQPEGVFATSGTFTGNGYDPVSYGSSSDTWSSGFSANDINDPGFGLRIKCYNQSASRSYVAQVDYVQIQVFYTPALPDKLVVKTNESDVFVQGDVVAFKNVAGFTSINGFEGTITEIPDSTSFVIQSLTHPWPDSFYGPNDDTGNVNNLIASYARVTTKLPHTFSIGTPVTFSGLTGLNVLNGTSHVIIRVPSANKLDVPVDHADQDDTSETGNISQGDISAYPVLRAFHETAGRVFAIVGAELYEIFADKSYKARGSIADDQKPAFIVSSAKELCLCSAGNLYSYNLDTDALAAVSDGAGGYITNIVEVAFCDGYFLALIKDSKPAQFIVSDLMDGTTWDPTNTAKMSMFPDAAVTMIFDHREIIFQCGTKSVAYYNSGNPDMPFEAVPGSYIDQGAVALAASVRLDNTTFFIGKDDRGWGVAYRMEGYRPQRVSNHAVEGEWQSYGDISDAVGYGFQINGHAFWHLYFPTANKAWRYDVSTGLWHEVLHWTGSDWEAHRSQCHVSAFNKHLVGDWKTGTIYEMSSDIYDDFGTELRRLRRTPHVIAEGKYLHFDRIEIEGEFGVDVQLFDGAGNLRPPQMMIRWSDTDTRKWSNETWISAGAVGDDELRAVRRQMGRCWGPRGRVYEMVVSDPVPWSITEAYLEVS